MSKAKQTKATKTNSNSSSSTPKNGKAALKPVINPPEGRFGETITLNPDPELPRYLRFTFGLGKGRMIVRNFDFIKKWVESHKDDAE